MTNEQLADQLTIVALTFKNATVPMRTGFLKLLTEHRSEPPALWVCPSCGGRPSDQVHIRVLELEKLLERPDLRKPDLRICHWCNNQYDRAKASKELSFLRSGEKYNSEHFCSETCGDQHLDKTGRAIL